MDHAFWLNGFVFEEKAITAAIQTIERLGSGRDLKG
jgi:hypothetical protein